jgi:hypothetical protein
MKVFDVGDVVIIPDCDPGIVTDIDVSDTRTPIEIEVNGERRWYGYSDLEHEGENA